jgi:hypothetical protein
LTAYTDLVAVVRAKLASKGYTLQRSTILRDGQPSFLEVTFPGDVFALPLIAIPDVHLADGTGADIFAAGAFAAHSKRLFDFIHLAAYDVMTAAYQGKLELVQLGDWYDIWRAYPDDLSTPSYRRIEEPYKEIIHLDADIGLKHLVGNHDAAFARGLSSYRSSQPELFPFGSWLAGGASVFGLHGHQSDAMSLTDAPDHPLAAKFIAFLSGLARGSHDSSFWQSVEDAADKGTFGDAILTWAKGVFLGVRPDGHAEITAHAAPFPIANWGPIAAFSVNGSADKLHEIVAQIAKPQGAPPAPLRCLVVGHSHIPRVSWVTTATDPVVVIDVGSWAYGSSNVLLAAGNAAGVYDVGFAP